MEHHQLVRTQRKSGIGTAVIVVELYFKYAIGEQRNYGTHLASLYPSIKYVLKHDHNIEETNIVFHIAPSLSNRVNSCQSGSTLAITSQSQKPPCS